VSAYRDMIALRRNFHGNTKGLQGHHCSVTHINNEGKVLAYHRWHEGGEGDDVVIVANFSNQTLSDYYIGMPKPGMWRVRFNSSSQLYDDYIDNVEVLDTEATEGECDGQAWNANVSVGAYGIVILSQDSNV
jgi:1,4-alpha-glucan branching enzyme